MALLPPLKNFSTGLDLRPLGDTDSIPLVVLVLTTKELDGGGGGDELGLVVVLGGFGIVVLSFGVVVVGEVGVGVEVVLFDVVVGVTEIELDLFCGVQSCTPFTTEQIFVGGQQKSRPTHGRAVESIHGFYYHRKTCQRCVPCI